MEHNVIRMKVVNAQGHTDAVSNIGTSISLVHTNEYQEGDRIYFECDQPGTYCMVQLEDTLAPALIYIKERVFCYYIPTKDQRVVFSPKAFYGSRHLIRARIATESEIRHRRNLAFNPYDQHGDDGCFPHSKANVETRGEAVFASYNAIDGIYENASHGEWPYQSWGINRDPKAAWTLDFGRPVELDELRITLRADFPHDSWWTHATVEFSDGSSELLSFEKTASPQSFPIQPRTVQWLILKDLIKAQDNSPFPALTQFEAWGKNI